MSVNLKEMFHVKHKFITALIICGLFTYGGISYTHAKNIQSYHPNVQLLAYRNKLQSSLNQLGNQDVDKAKVQYNHKSHHLTFFVVDYDSIRPFQKNVARNQTNIFKKQNHIKYVTYSIKITHIAIKQHLIQIKENKEQDKENKIMLKQQQIAEQKQIQRKHQQAIRNQQHKKMQIKRNQQKQQNKKKHHVEDNKHHNHRH